MKTELNKDLTIEITNEPMLSISVWSHECVILDAAEIRKLKAFIKKYEELYGVLL